MLNSPPTGHSKVGHSVNVVDVVSLPHFSLARLLPSACFPHVLRLSYIFHTVRTSPLLLLFSSLTHTTQTSLTSHQDTSSTHISIRFQSINIVNREQSSSQAHFISISSIHRPDHYISLPRHHNQSRWGTKRWRSMTSRCKAPSPTLPSPPAAPTGCGP